MYRITQVGHIIISISVYTNSFVASSVIAIATIGTIEPHFKLVGTILRQLCTLSKEHLANVSRRAIECGIAIPGRYIEAIFHIQRLGSSRKRFWKIERPAILVASTDNAVLSSFCGPQTESVVVFHHSDAACHTRITYCLKPLTRIGLACRCKKALGFVTFSPLHIGICVHTIVEKGIILGFLPFHLSLCRQWKHGSRFVIGIG